MVVLGLSSEPSSQSDWKIFPSKLLYHFGLLRGVGVEVIMYRSAYVIIDA